MKTKTRWKQKHHVTWYKQKHDDNRPDEKVFGEWSVACLGPQPTSHGPVPVYLY